MLQGVQMGKEREERDHWVWPGGSQRVFSQWNSWGWGPACSRFRNEEEVRGRRQWEEPMVLRRMAWGGASSLKSSPLSLATVGGEWLSASPGRDFSSHHLFLEAQSGYRSMSLFPPLFERNRKPDAEIPSTSKLPHSLICFPNTFH